MRLILSCGGTGGHIYPAIAVAEAVKIKIPEAEILFVGARGRMEMEKIPKAGFSIKGLWISGFQRKLTFSNLLFPIKVIISLWQTLQITRKFKPHIVAGFGGYASGVAVYIATRLGIKTLIQEQNSYPGVTNRILGSRVDSICIGHSNSERFFVNDRILYTGNPVRNVSRHMPGQNSSREHFGLDADRKTVLVMGGSLGSRSLNEAMKWSFDNLKDDEKIQIIWQCGNAYFDEYKECRTANLKTVCIAPFIDDMVKAYAASDLVISRAGALTVSELCAFGKAAILVPSPNVTADHQTKNAQSLLDHDAAIMIEDRNIDKMLIPEIRRVLLDQNILKKLEAQIKKLAKPNATSDIADELIRLAKMH